MNNNSIITQIKLWLDLNKSNLIPGLKIVVPIFLAIFIFRNIPSIINQYTLAKLDSKTYGIIDTIQKREGIKESQVGGKIVIKDYKIKYHYQIDEASIVQEEIIGKEGLSFNQINVLNQLTNGDTVLIKYDSRNVKNAKIKVE